MADRDAIQLPTDGGSLELASIPGDDPAECGACGRRGDGDLFAAATVHLARDPDDGFRIVLCGTCLARGAAIAMGRAHVDAGGAVTDLRY